MIRVYLNKTTGSSVPPEINKSFSFNTRYEGAKRATIYLTSNGEYRISIDGIIYSNYEQSAKRSPYYKKTMREVTNEMIVEIGKYNASFTKFYKLTKRPNNRNDVENDLKNERLNNYVRKNFYLTEPRKTEVLDDLRNEANALFYSIWRSRNSEKNKYINEHLDEEYNKRNNLWNELKSFHESIQDVLEIDANKKYQKEYEAKCKLYENELVGPYEVVAERIKAIASIWKLPFDLIIDCDYNPSRGIINCIVHLPLSFQIPTKNALLLNSGRISVVDKNKKELENDFTTCLFSISYYLAGHLFSTSVNVETVRLSVIKDTIGYYWVEFDRNEFAEIEFSSSLYPTNDIFNQLLVVNFKAPSIVPMELDVFNKQIEDKILVADLLKDNPHLMTLLIKDAEMIAKHLNDADLNKAITEAKRKKQTFVIVAKTYASILKEVQTLPEPLFQDEDMKKYSTTEGVPPELKVPPKKYDNVSNYQTLLREAACYAIKRYKYSAELLQNDLSVDNITARKLIMELKKHGVLGSLDQDGFYKVLVDSEKVLDFVFSWTK